MPREHIGPSQPETQSNPEEASQLSRPMRILSGKRLLLSAKEILRYQSRELTMALQGAFFNVDPGANNDLKRGIVTFRKDNFVWQVKHTTDESFRVEELTLTKTPPIEDSASQEIEEGLKLKIVRDVNSEITDADIIYSNKGELETNVYLRNTDSVFKKGLSFLLDFRFGNSTPKPRD